MKKNLLFGALLLGSMAASAQTVLFQDSFETYEDFAIENVGNWILTDVDMSTTYGFTAVDFPNAGSEMAYIVFNSTATTPPMTASATSDWSARTGSKAMICFAAETPSNNDWLISPQIQLAASGNTLSFWAKTCDATYAESFKVGISTTGSNVTDFVVISPGASVTAPAAWTQYTYNLDAYNSQNIRVSINCVSNDRFGFAVDDFIVQTSATAGVKDALASQFSVFPNPATNVINVSNNNNILVDGIQIVDLNGRTVKSVKFDGVASAEVNISDLSSGMYMMTVSSDKGTMTKKIVKN